MQIPRYFLVKISKQLERNGIVQLKRGVTGGIALVRKPQDITLYDVIVAMENAVALNRCVIDNKSCGLISYCPVHPIWFKVRDKLIEALKEINFSCVIT